MTKWMIIMSGAKYEETTRKLVEQVPALGVDRVLVFDDVWVNAHPFRQLNAWLWDHPGDKNGKRGFGWYGWKSLLLIDALDRAADGDVVTYVDADVEPTGERLDVLYDVAARDGAMLFSSTGHKQTTWCKTDCYVAMGQPIDHALPAGCARFMSFRKGGWKERQFLYEWLTYSVNKLAQTFDPSVCGPEPVGFEEHRTEQAIMSNLAHRYGYKLWRECDESGEGWPEDRDVMPRPLFRQVRQGSCANGVGSAFRNV
jgi:hypothetical protein